MDNCKDCIHSVFDPLWGEYKCKHHQRRVYILLSKDECPNYKKDPNPEKKYDKIKEDD